MITQHLDASGMMLVRVASETLTDADIRHVLFDWPGDPRFDPEVPVLWDLRGAIVGSTVTEVLRTRGWVEQLPPAQRRSGRTGWLVDDPDIHELILRLRTLSSWDTEWQVFNTEESAIDWVLTGVV